MNNKNKTEKSNRNTVGYAQDLGETAVLWFSTFQKKKRKKNAKLTKHTTQYSL